MATGMFSGEYTPCSTTQADPRPNTSPNSSFSLEVGSSAGISSPLIFMMPSGPMCRSCLRKRSPSLPISEKMLFSISLTYSQSICRFIFFLPRISPYSKIITALALEQTARTSLAAGIVVFVVSSINLMLALQTMIRRRDQASSYLGTICCERNTNDYQYQVPAIFPLDLQFTRSSSKISLKRTKSRQSQKVISLPTCNDYSQCRSNQTAPLTPKSSLPKVVFSWGNPLAETKKEGTAHERLRELQMRETKSKKTPTKLTKRNILAYRASVVSVKSNSSRKEPRFQESVILVDYFNPNSQQLHKINPFLPDQSRH